MVDGLGFFGKEIIPASFHYAGKRPDVNEWLKICVIIRLMISNIDITNLQLIPSIPMELVVIDETAFLTSLSATRQKLKG